MPVLLLLTACPNKRGSTPNEEEREDVPANTQSNEGVMRPASDSGNIAPAPSAADAETKKTIQETISNIKKPLEEIKNLDAKAIPVDPCVALLKENNCTENAEGQQVCKIKTTTPLTLENPQLYLKISEQEKYTAQVSNGITGDFESTITFPKAILPCNEAQIQKDFTFNYSVTAQIPLEGKGKGTPQTEELAQSLAGAQTSTISFTNNTKDDICGLGLAIVPKHTTITAPEYEPALMKALNDATVNETNLNAIASCLYKSSQASYVNNCKTKVAACKTLNPCGAEQQQQQKACTENAETVQQACMDKLKNNCIRFHDIKKDEVKQKKSKAVEQIQQNVPDVK